MRRETALHRGLIKIDRARVRKWAIRTVVAVLGFLATTLVSQWIIEYANQQGLYNDPAGQLSRLLATLDALVKNTTLRYLACALGGASAGFLAGLRAELWFRQPPQSEGLVSEYRHVGLASRSLFEGWDHVDPLTLRDAACLWAEVDPNETPGKVLDGAAGGILRMLQQAAAKKRIQVAQPYRSIATIMESITITADPAMVHETCTVTRAELHNLADARGDRPRFLFMDTR